MPYHYCDDTLNHDCIEPRERAEIAKVAGDVNCYTGSWHCFEDGYTLSASILAAVVTVPGGHVCSGAQAPLHAAQST